MKLCPREKDALLLHQVGFLAQKRLARGCRLNQPEAVALISSVIQEMVRDGNYTVAELMDKGKEFLGRNQVMSGVEDMIQDILVEATFPDGTKLVTVNRPICRKNGNLSLALYGSFLPVPDVNLYKEERPIEGDFGFTVLRTPPGCVFPAKNKDIEINKGRKKVVLDVASICDRPIQVGSHYHFIEVNKNLIFDRALAYGMRLNIPAGTAVRFEPGITKTVTLVEIAGKKVIRGGNNIASGPVSEDNLQNAMINVCDKSFGHRKQEIRVSPLPRFISRFNYAKMYGPTLGDKIRLGDTSLLVEVEKDFAVYGDECKFGGGKVLRDGMGQMSAVSCDEVLDAIITNCLIIDAVTGIIKADVGIKNGKIAGIGKAGSKDIMNGVTPGMLIGPGTDAIIGEGLMLTAGAIDSHVHFICPQLIHDAISSGITTLIGGGTGPSAGSCATTCTPSPNHIRNMMQSTDSFPLNFGFTGKGCSSNAKDLCPGLIEQIEAGAIGLKIHEDWGSTPAVIRSTLDVADAYDIQILIHTDTLNESGCVEDTIEAFGGRTIHAYHSEGAGGGHAPDIITVCGMPNVIPSSTNPTRPFTINTLDEHIDMLMVCHSLDKNLREDLAFAESRIRAETLAAEDILHDMGAISIMSSDSQAMGRISEVIQRTWQTADKMKKLNGPLPNERGTNDNFRVKRYIAKYTINPAIAHGISHLVGSIEVGKLADLILWNPAFFGTKPNMIIKSGVIAWSTMGLPNASIPTVQPVMYREMYGAFGGDALKNSYIFVSKVSHDKKIVHDYGLQKRITTVHGCRNITKHNMILNNEVPKLKVDPQKFKVYVEKNIEGKPESVLLTCQPADKLPLTQRYFLC